MGKAKGVGRAAQRRRQGREKRIKGETKGGRHANAHKVVRFLDRRRVRLSDAMREASGLAFGNETGQLQRVVGYDERGNKVYRGKAQEEAEDNFVERFDEAELKAADAFYGERKLPSFAHMNWSQDTMDEGVESKAARKRRGHVALKQRYGTEHDHDAVVKSMAQRAIAEGWYSDENGAQMTPDEADGDASDAGLADDMSGAMDEGADEMQANTERSAFGGISTGLADMSDESEDENDRGQEAGEGGAPELTREEMLPIVMSDGRVVRPQLRHTAYNMSALDIAKLPPSRRGAP